jgi:hypothetical protein
MSPQFPPRPAGQRDAGRIVILPVHACGLLGHCCILPNFYRRRFSAFRCLCGLFASRRFFGGGFGI